MHTEYRFNCRIYSLKNYGVISLNTVRTRLHCEENAVSVCPITYFRGQKLTFLKYTVFSRRQSILLCEN